MNGQAKTPMPSTSVLNAKVLTGIKREKLTQKRLKEVVRYNPKTGEFIWRINYYKAKIGKTAGFLTTDGYVCIIIDKKRYMAHRLASLYMLGYFPEHEIDHKKGVKIDNRWSELRHVTTSCNQLNTKIRKNSTSGFTGVTWNHIDKTWMSRICIQKKRYSLGRYNSPLEAALARFIFENECLKMECNYRSELVKAIKKAWPEFKYGADNV